MADFCDEFVTHLKTKATVIALVGSGSSARMYPDDLKQGATLPALTYGEIGGDFERHLRGPIGLRKAVVEVYAYGATRAAANELAEAVRVAITGTDQRGNYGSTHVAEVTVSYARVTGIDEPQDASDTKRYWTRYVYDIWHAQST